MADPRTSFADNIYISLSCRNNQNKAIRPKFLSDNNGTICENPMMYYVMITQFRLSRSAHELFYFDNTKETLFIKEIENGPGLLLGLVNSIFRGDRINPGDIRDARSGPIYYISQFIDMMNFISFRFTFSLNAEDKIQIIGTTDYLEMSPELYTFFPNLPATYLENGNYLVKFTLNTVTGNYECIQEYKSLYAFNDIDSIIIYTSNLPVNSQQFSSNNETDIEEKVIAQFTPSLSQNDGNDRSDWLYFSNEARLIDLKSSDAITNFTFSARIIRRNGNHEDYHIMPGDSASVTFRFAKKALFNNEYNLTSEYDRIKQNPYNNYHK